MYCTSGHFHAIRRCKSRDIIEWRRVQFFFWNTAMHSIWDCFNVSTYSLSALSFCHCYLPSNHTKNGNESKRRPIAGQCNHCVPIWRQQNALRRASSETNIRLNRSSRVPLNGVVDTETYQSIDQSIYLSKCKTNTGPDTKGGCNHR